MNSHSSTQSIFNFFEIATPIFSILVVSNTHFISEKKPSITTFFLEKSFKKIISSVSFPFNPFNELIKTQQQHSKFILIDKDLNHCDEFRFLIKVIYNYLTETDQHKNFILEKQVAITIAQIACYSENGKTFLPQGSRNLCDKH